MGNIGSRIAKGLTDFVRKLKSGEPIGVTRVTRHNTPDGQMHKFRHVTLHGSASVPSPENCPPECDHKTFHFCMASGTHCDKHCCCPCDMCI